MPEQAGGYGQWHAVHYRLAGYHVAKIVQADAACEQLRTCYPEVHDWLMRKAMVREARGETALAIEYCERTIAWMDAHPENFDPESRCPFRKDIERLRASLGSAC